MSFQEHLKNALPETTSSSPEGGSREATATAAIDPDSESTTATGKTRGEERVATTTLSGVKRPASPSWVVTADSEKNYCYTLNKPPAPQSEASAPQSEASAPPPAAVATAGKIYERENGLLYHSMLRGIHRCRMRTLFYSPVVHSFGPIGLANT